MLKKQYRKVYDMLNRSGFGWNDIKKCVEVDSDEAWLSYVQVNKDAEGWRNKSIPIYDRLANIFGKDRAIGRGVETPADMRVDVDDETEEDDTTRSVNQTSSRPSNRRKRSCLENMQDGMLEVASSFKKIFEQMRLIREQLIPGNGDGKDIALRVKERGLF
ncbi:hypothetical protein L484_003214 [Morus notabilis]|uniref:Myb/SANT-like domain-containing protein n=1 Tax=Morus notabilis TaxID=981085 RepID=W9R559_9ROSA|nr:hypothetical protein L484_003214 [Morus notabilis]